MNKTNLKTLISWSGLFMVGFANAQTGANVQQNDPFQEGVKPVVISAAEEDELRSYSNQIETRLKKVMRLAQATYPRNGQREDRIRMYEEEISKIVPDSALDLQNQSTTLLRIALNQGVYLEHALQNEAWCTAKERENILTFSIQTAISLYQNDIDLFVHKRKLEEEYMRYVSTFAGSYQSWLGDMSKREAVKFFNESAQLMLNVLLAKGNIMRNMFAGEVDNLRDIIEKTNPAYTVIDTNKRKVQYASQLMSEVMSSITQKWAKYDEELAAKKLQEEKEQSQRSLERKLIPFYQSASAASSIVIRGFHNISGSDIYSSNQQILLYLSYSVGNDHSPKEGILVCSSNKFSQSGLYALGTDDDARPIATFEKNADCFKFIGVAPGSTSDTYFRIGLGSTSFSIMRTKPSCTGFNNLIQDIEVLN